MLKMDNIIVERKSPQRKGNDGFVLVKKLRKMDGVKQNDNFICHVAGGWNLMMKDYCKTRKQLRGHFFLNKSLLISLGLKRIMIKMDR